ncbi:hypothetical protein HDU80_002121 [Chytriomyces hyalinus]|nr:hypothetical protein HDU80_002121 [Chytriomyces hyalinus]
MHATTHNSELGGLLLSLATIHLFLKWFKMFCGILSDKNLLHCVKPTLLIANPPHAQTYAQAVAQDPTLQSFTYVLCLNFPDIYFMCPFTAYTFISRSGGLEGSMCFVQEAKIVLRGAAGVFQELPKTSMLRGEWRDRRECIQWVGTVCFGTVC